MINRSDYMKYLDIDETNDDVQKWNEVNRHSLMKTDQNGNLKINLYNSDMTNNNKVNINNNNNIYSNYYKIIYKDMMIIIYLVNKYYY